MIAESLHALSKLSVFLCLNIFIDECMFPYQFNMIYLQITDIENYSML